MRWTTEAASASCLRSKWAALRCSLSLLSALATPAQVTAHTCHLTRTCAAKIVKSSLSIWIFTCDATLAERVGERGGGGGREGVGERSGQVRARALSSERYARSLSAYCALTVCYALSLPTSLSSLCACLPVVIWSRLLECFEISSVRPSLSLSLSHALQLSHFLSLLSPLLLLTVLIP